MTSGLGRLGDQSLEIRLGLAAAVVAVIWAVAILDPLGAATIDPDASSSVLYFGRISSGTPLEAFVPTTPKPLLTLLYGLTWSLGHDWRWLVWETIAAFGLAVGSTAAFVARLADRVAAAAGGGLGVAAPVAGAIFAAAALLTSSDILLEVSRANSLVWALAFWSLAGLFATGDPPRPVLAGTMLLLAGLCRFETLALDVVALAAFLVASPAGAYASRDMRRGIPAPVRPPGALAGVIIAFLAIPVAMLHDWLLAGDPFYGLGVPARYTEIFNAGLAPIDPLTYARTFAAGLAPDWPLVLLAAIGLLGLARRRELLTLAGIMALGLGVTVLLFGLAARGTYISNRYSEPIDLALVAAAAVGVGWLAGIVLGRLPAVRAPAALVAGAGLGALLLWPALPWDRRATTELADVRTASARIGAAMPSLDVVIHDLEPAPTQFLVPSRDVARVAVELGAPLTLIVNSYATLLNDGIAGLQDGQIVLHDDAADRPAALFRPLEVDGTQVVDGVTLTRLPLNVPGTWLLRVGEGGS